jgi:hypothetical protein
MYNSTFAEAKQKMYSYKAYYISEKKGCSKWVTHSQFFLPNFKSKIHNSSPGRKERRSRGHPGNVQ